jgi:hypothetical protein
MVQYTEFLIILSGKNMSIDARSYSHSAGKPSARGGALGRRGHHLDLRG